MWCYKIILLILLVSGLILCTFLLAQEKLHVSKIEEIRFSIKQFKIVGNLYLPKEAGKDNLATWVHDDGSDHRSQGAEAYPQCLQAARNPFWFRDWRIVWPVG